MAILVTGGLGVNGAWAVRKLVERGAEVIVVDRNTDLGLIGPHAKAIELVKADILDGDAIRALLATRDVDCILHMAALVSGLQEDPLRGFEVNALGTVKLLDLAQKAGVRRFVYTSSRAVYGNITGEHAYPHYRPVSEDHCLAAQNVYDVSKLAGELMGRNFARSGLKFVALRFASIFGPGKLTRHGPMGILSRLVENAMVGAPLVIEKGGTERDDFIYVDDAAEACAVAVVHPKPKYDAYNISRGVGATLEDFADAVRQHLPNAKIEIGPGLDFLNAGVKYAGVLDNSRAREDLGFSPRFDLVSGVAHYITAMEELGLQPVVT